MKISERFQRLLDKTALIIVLSKQNGKLLVVSNEEINEFDEFAAEKPRFIDKAGMFFKKKGRGRPVGASAIKENLKENLEKELIKKFKDSVTDVLNKNKNFDYIYLFASPHIIGEATRVLSDDFNINPDKIIEGNFIKSHPFKLLEKIFAE